VRCIITTFNNSDEGSCHITLENGTHANQEKARVNPPLSHVLDGERNKANHYLLNTKSSSVVTRPRGLGGPMYYRVDR